MDVSEHHPDSRPGHQRGSHDARRQLPDGLAQYRGVGGGEVRASTVLASSEPPDAFTDDDVARFVRDQLAAGTIAGPDADNQRCTAS
jgi:hypothetical protein